MNPSVPGTAGVLASNKFRAARTNLLIVVALTVLNIIFLYADSYTVMLFSATLPYLFVLGSMLLDFPLMLVGAILILLLYFMCWLLSSKHPVWMIVAAVMFTLDTAVLLVLGIDFGDRSSVMDLLIHAMILYYLISGVIYGFKLRKTPDPVSPEPSQMPGTENTTPIRIAETDVKHRLLLETELPGMHICYRRVKPVDQLIINGYIYAELPVKFIETAHELTAVYQGTPIAVGYDGRNSFIAVNGQVIRLKRRLF